MLLSVMFWLVVAFVIMFTNKYRRRRILILIRNISNYKREKFFETSLFFLKWVLTRPSLGRDETTHQQRSLCRIPKGLNYLFSHLKNNYISYRPSWKNTEAATQGSFLARCKGKHQEKAAKENV